MSVKPYITIRAADEKARFAANELKEVLKDFNEQHPDPDAELVAESLEYVDDDYLVRICALTIAEAHIVGRLVQCTPHPAASNPVEEVQRNAELAHSSVS